MIYVCLIYDMMAPKVLVSVTIEVRRQSSGRDTSCMNQHRGKKQTQLTSILTMIPSKPAYRLYS